MIQIPYIFDNSKNVTATSRQTDDYQSGHELEVQNTVHFYPFHQSLESLGAQSLNLQAHQLPTNDQGQSMFVTNFCSSHSFHSYIPCHDALSKNQSTTLAQSLVPRPEVENSSQKVAQVPGNNHNHSHSHASDVKVERAPESDNSFIKHATKSSPPPSTQKALPNLVNQKPPVYTKWTEREDELLRAAVSIYGPHKWSLVATNVPNRTPMQCSARWVGALNPSILKGRWTAQEDAVLTETVQQYINAVDSQNNPQPIPWNKISKRIPQRTGAQCQARWTEALDPHIKKGKWSPKEDEILKEGVSIYGRCWIRIAEMIDGRTQRQCPSTAAATDVTSNSAGNTIQRVNNGNSNNIPMLTPPTTTPSTPAQTIKNFSSLPFVQSVSSQIGAPFGSIGVSMPPPPDFNNVSAIIARQNSTSPEVYQNPIFSGPMTPAASPGNMTTTMTGFFTNDDNNSRQDSNFSEAQSMIFQPPTPNPLCFYDGASYSFDPLSINQITYI
ncbi:6381_t:CDS:2 [Acaulospora colombiana]|uniref:6381_t:CDS:1 n=1 Tax=Acaulospora colombiana TaxID=27376 RepID=A0ACA9LR61_9GLOM|nr:6381_t:CDS:2 [Acaulospora colombiana]